MYLNKFYLNKPLEMKCWDEKTGDTQQPQGWGSCAPLSLENIFVSNTYVGSNPKKNHWLQPKVTFLRSMSDFHTHVIISNVTKLISDSHLKKTQLRF